MIRRVQEILRIEKISHLYCLLAILTLGVLLRLFYLIELSNTPGFAFPSLDARFHDYWGRAIVTGEWALPQFQGDPQIGTTAYQKAPGYSWFLSGIYTLLGLSYFSPRIVQMTLGLANALIAFFLGKKLFGEKVGLLFSFFMSTYWLFLYFEGEFYGPTLALFFLLLLLYSLLLWMDKISFRRTLLSGFLLTLGALVRPNFLLFAPFISAWMVWVLYRRENLKQFPLAFLGLFLGTVLTLSPVTVRNYVVAKEFVLVSTNGGLNLLIGNNEKADGINATIPGLEELTGHKNWTSFNYPAIVSALGKKLGREISHSEASAYWSAQAMDYIKNNPGQTLERMGKKALLFWGPEVVGNPTEIYYDRLHSRTLSLLPFNFPFVLTLALLGLLLFVLNGSTLVKDQKDGLLLLLLLLLVYFLSFLPFTVSARTRIPILPILFILASYGLVQMFVYYKGRLYRPLALCLLSLIPLYLFLSISWVPYHPSESLWHYERGIAYQRSGKAREAEKEFNESLRLKPDFVEAHSFLGSLLFSQGRVGEALFHYGNAVELRPSFAEMYYNMGLSYARMGRVDEAIAHYRKTIDMKPEFASAYYSLGMAYRGLGKREEAENAFQEAFRLDPSMRKRVLR